MSAPNLIYCLFWGVLSLLALYVIFAKLTGKWNIEEIYTGATGTPSATKLQWFLWTAVGIFAYVAMYAARSQRNEFTPINEIPANLLIAMGVSIGTNIGSRAIQASQTANGQKKTVKSQAKTIFDDEDGNPDLSRLQMLAWTFVSLGIYIVHLIQQIQSGPYNTLPDIDTSLMVLMGLGQGAFLGKQLITTDTPIINRLTPNHGRPGDSIIISGRAFGDDPGSIYFNDTPIGDEIEWKDKSIKFTLPAKNPKDQSNWVEGDKVSVRVVCNGRQALNPPMLTIDYPKITSLAPMPAKAGEPITIYGLHFGDDKEQGKVWFDPNQILEVTDWKDTVIKCKMPDKKSDGAQWNNDQITVKISVDERQAVAPQTLTIKAPNP